MLKIIVALFLYSTFKSAFAYYDDFYNYNYKYDLNKHYDWGDFRKVWNVLKTTKSPILVCCRVLFILGHFLFTGRHSDILIYLVLESLDRKFN